MPGSREDETRDRAKSCPLKILEGVGAGESSEGLEGSQSRHRRTSTYPPGSHNPIIRSCTEGRSGGVPGDRLEEVVFTRGSGAGGSIQASAKEHQQEQVKLVEEYGEVFQRVKAAYKIEKDEFQQQISSLRSKVAGSREENKGLQNYIASLEAQMKALKNGLDPAPPAESGGASGTGAGASESSSDSLIEEQHTEKSREETLWSDPSNFFAEELKRMRDKFEEVKPTAGSGAGDSIQDLGLKLEVWQNTLANHVRGTLEKCRLKDQRRHQRHRKELVEEHQQELQKQQETYKIAIGKSQQETRSLRSQVAELGDQIERLINNKKDDPHAARHAEGGGARGGAGAGESSESSKDMVKTLADENRILKEVNESLECEFKRQKSIHERHCKELVEAHREDLKTQQEVYNMAIENSKQETKQEIRSLNSKVEGLSNEMEKLITNKKDSHPARRAEGGGARGGTGAGGCVPGAKRKELNTEELLEETPPRDASHFEARFQQLKENLTGKSRKAFERLQEEYQQRSRPHIPFGEWRDESLQGHEKNIEQLKNDHIEESRKAFELLKAEGQDYPFSEQFNQILEVITKQAHKELVAEITRIAEEIKGSVKVQSLKDEIVSLKAQMGALKNKIHSAPPAEGERASGEPSGGGVASTEETEAPETDVISRSDELAAMSRAGGRSRRGLFRDCCCTEFLEGSAHEDQQRGEQREVLLPK